MPSIPAHEKTRIFLTFLKGKAYPLPQFWFTEKERSTFSEAEKIQIERVGKLSAKELQKGNSEIFELKPTFHGFSVDLKKLYKYFRKKNKSNQANIADAKSRAAD